MNSSELVRSLFQRNELPRVPFIPLVWSLAARVQQVSVREMATNPSLMAGALSNAQKLFGYDGITMSMDTSLEAEALGCSIEWVREDQPPKVSSHPLQQGKTQAQLDEGFLEKGRMPVVLEAARRINAVAGKQVAVIGVVTGPATLGQHLAGESFWPGLEGDALEARKLMESTRKCCQDVVKAYCESGITTIMLVEGLPGRLGETGYRQLKAAYRSIWNVLRYFRGSSILLARGWTADQAELMCGLGADAIIGGGAPETPHLRQMADRQAICYAETIRTRYLLPSHDRDALSEVQRVLQAPPGKRCFFVTTDGEIPYQASLNSLHEVANALREFPLDRETSG